MNRHCSVILSAVLFVLLPLACKKATEPEPDYRDAYTGSWNMKVERYRFIMEYDMSLTIDTITGRIEKEPATKDRFV